MGQIELTESLARAGIKKGEVRNPGGHFNKAKIFRTTFIKNALYAALDEPCGVPGYEHMTKFEFGIDTICDRWMDGDRWAVSWVSNRLFGRVPLNVEMDVDVTHQAPDLPNLTNEQLLARLDQLRARLVAEPPAPALPAADAELIPDPHPPDGERGTR